MNSITYPYLSDLRFLKELDELNIKEQFVKIIVLDWLENPITNIEGRVSGGSMNLDGSSAVRRSGSITFICDDEYYNVLDVNNLISINKKIKIEIGYANTTDKYTEYDKIWFPQGVFVIINPSITHNNQGLSIAISFKDKMCLLNGECGGVLPASVTFHEEEDAQGNITRIPYYTIIRRLVHEFGGEQMGKIIINDIDTRIKKAMKWVGAENLELDLVEDGFIEIALPPNKRIDISAYFEGASTKTTFEITTSEQVSLHYFEIQTKGAGDFIETAVTFPQSYPTSLISTWVTLDLTNVENVYLFSKYTQEINIKLKIPKQEKFEPEQDVGYIYTDFCPAVDLIGNAGQSVVTVLDTIKNQLGNYEYFYDIDGNFVFQEIRNYLNTSQSTSEYERLQQSNQAYFIPSVATSVYKFTNGSLITAYGNTPQYNNIKNDFIVWGARQTSGGGNVPIRYHLAFDNKPTVGHTYLCETNKNSNGDEEIISIPQEVKNIYEQPIVGRPGIIYAIKDKYYRYDAILVGQTERLQNNSFHPRDNYVLGPKSTYLLVCSEPFLSDDIILESNNTDLTTTIVSETLIEGDIQKPQDSGSGFWYSTASGLEEKCRYFLWGEVTPEGYPSQVDSFTIQVSQEGEFTDPDTGLDTSTRGWSVTITQEFEPTEFSVTDTPFSIMEDIGPSRYDTGRRNVEWSDNCSINFLHEGFAKDVTIQIKNNSNKEVLMPSFTIQGTLPNNATFTLYEVTAGWQETEYKRIQTQDYRTELYLQGVAGAATGDSVNRYFQELKAEWPKMFTLEPQGSIWYDIEKFTPQGTPANPDYYLDIIDTQGPVSEFSIPTIGVRSHIWTEKGVNCLFETPIPDVILIEAGTATTTVERDEAAAKGQSYYQVPSSIYNALAGGGYQNSAFNAIRDVLYQYTNYNESITLTALPIYYLEPNTCITVEDEKSSIHGDYMIKTISRPFDCNGTMQITATKALERF